MSLLFFGAVALLALAILIAVSWAHSAFVLAQPDEWLLRIRNGRLVDAGIGISLWRRPGDVVARFTSTLQRVGFKVDARTSDRVVAVVEGFVLWSVADTDDAPFRAFQRLGLVNLDAPPPELRSRKHLLSSPQHRAFQRLLAAAVQRLAARMSLDGLLFAQEELVAKLRQELKRLEDEVGIEIGEIQIVSVVPSDAELAQQMAAQIQNAIREDAITHRLAADERIKRAELESRDRLREREAEARTQELETRRALRLTEVEHDTELQRVEQEAVHALAERELASKLDRQRREAEAKRDTTNIVTAAEEQKSPEVREHELSLLVADKVGAALEHLPIKEARWVTVGNDSPVSTIAGLLEAARNIGTRS